MRYSPQREAIKEIVYSTNSHPTADWIFSQAKEQHPTISLGTVYRNLNQLSEQGVIRQIHDGTMARFDWNTSDHDHLKCTLCGELFDVNILDTNLKKSVKKTFNFHVDNVEMVLIGTCQKHKP